MLKQGYCFSHTSVVIRNCNKLFYKYIDGIGDLQPVDVYPYQLTWRYKERDKITINQF